MPFLTRREALSNPARALLHGLVQSVPGISLTTLARRVGLETSSVHWHLRKLADAGLVVAERHGPNRIFFATDAPAAVREQARAAHALQSDAARAVLGTVVARAPATARVVAERTDTTVAQARHQLHRLHASGLLERVEDPSGHLHYPSALAAGALRLADAYDEAVEAAEAVEVAADGVGAA